MIVTDASKLFVRNGGLVWKILPFMLVSLLIICGIAITICYPLINDLSNAGFFTQVSDIFSKTFFNFRLDMIFASASQTLVLLFDLISQNIETVLPLIIILILLISLGSSFLIGLSELAIADCLYGYMTSNSKFSFYSCLIKNLGKSLKLQLAKLLIVWPIDIIITGAFVGMLLLFTVQNTIVTVIAPFVIVLVMCLLVALRQTLFCMWAPCMIVRNRTVWGALKESCICMAQNFNAIYGKQIIITLIYIAVNIATCIFTASVGLFLTIPATLLFSNILGQTCFFYINGLRFYVDENQIISPKKREDWESLKTLKDIV